MRGYPILSENYFEKYKNEPVNLKPYDPKSKLVTSRYIEELKKTLSFFDVFYSEKGSSSFGILGKGDIDIGVYPRLDMQFFKVIKTLINHYGKISNLEESYAKFNTQYESSDIEITVMPFNSRVAKIDIAIHRFMLESPNLIKEYENLKRRFSHSKREYMKRKYAFFRNVADQIPENYEISEYKSVA